jgi:hypothetical protein
VAQKTYRIGIDFAASQLVEVRPGHLMECGFRVALISDVSHGFLSRRRLVDALSCGAVVGVTPSAAPQVPRSFQHVVHCSVEN